MSSRYIMDGDNSWLDNLTIFNDNLCSFYVGSVIVSMMSFVIAWWYKRYEKKKILNSVVNTSSQRNSLNNVDNSLSADSSIVTQMKMARQSAIVEQLSAGLTEDQLKEEREAEAEQLAAIFQLLRNQEDKFQVGSMEELEDQLRLYRH